MPLQAIVSQDLSRGANVVTNPYDIGQQQSILLTNLLLDEHGSVRTRDGTKILTTSPDAAGAIRPIVKLFDYIQQNGQIIKLAIIKGSTGNNQLYDRGQTPWTLLGTLGTTYAIPDILTFTNLALIVNGYEVPMSFDGTILKALTTSSGTVPAGASHHTLHQGYYWLWNTSFATTTADGQSSLRSSDLNNPNSWPLANQIFVDKDDGDSGQGMGQFTIAESGISPTTSQILFKAFRTYQMTGVFGSTNPAFAIQKVKTDMGCVGPRTIAFAPGFGLIRMTHRGFALFDGVTDKIISEEVRPLIFGSSIYEAVDWSRMQTAYAAVVPNPPLYICAVPVCNAASTGLVRVFAYDLVRKAWTILQYANPIATFAVIEEPLKTPVPDTTGFGQVWTLGPDTGGSGKAESCFFTGDLTVYSFKTDPLKLVYKLSTDGGKTFPTQHTTGFAPDVNDIIAARKGTAADGSPIFLLLHNDGDCVMRNTDLLTSPETSAWTRITPPGGGVGAPFSLEANGLNVVLGGQDSGDTKVWYSTDGGATFTLGLTVTGAPTTQPGTQAFCSPSAGLWLYLNHDSGKIYRSSDSGATWGAAVTTVTAGDAALVKAAAILAATPTRIVAIYKGQVVVSTDAGLTWTNKQNLTLPATSPASVHQAGIAYFANFGKLNGVTILGGASMYLNQFANGVTAAAFWRSSDLGETWTLVNVIGGFGAVVGTNMMTGFAARNGRGVINMVNLADKQRVWYNPSTGGGSGLPGVCPPALANLAMGDFSGGNVRQAFLGDTTDDGVAIGWQLLPKPVSSPSPQANGYYRRLVIKATNVAAGQQIAVQAVFGPITSNPPRTLQKTLTAPVAVGLGIGWGIQTWGTSPWGGVQWNSEVDFTADLGVIATNARAILSGTGPITLRGLEWHLRAKPLRRVSVFT